ncbi:MAG: metalloregulator ArsR/SmtB family transcription factor [Bauldia sp.]
MHSSRPDTLSQTFAALADPTRRAILARLTAGEASVAELAEPFALAQPTISKHLKVLEEAGLIERGRDAQRRPRRLRAAALKDIADWVEPFRREWEGRLDNLDRHLKTVRAGAGTKTPPAKPGRPNAGKPGPGKPSQE